MLAELQQVLRSEIPLTRHIGVSVDSYCDGELTISAPLENNINHKCTAFGGSLYSVAVLSGWGLVYLLLKEQGLAGHIVIQKSQVEYLLPVAETITATCAFKSEGQVSKFVKIYRRKGLARITLQSRILSEGKLAVLFSGDYVVHV